MKLTDRIAIVTGGGTGIGRATCLALSREGAAVVVNYSRRESAAQEVAGLIACAGGRALAYRADVSDEDQVRAMVEASVERFGRLDILVNNAGWTRIVPHADLNGLTPEVMDRTLAVNLKGPLYCARAAMPHMRRAGGGSIVNVTSVAGRLGVGSSMIYAASKAGLATMTKSMARAFAPEIRVNAVAPGFVDTGFAGWPPEAAERAKGQTHIGRLVTVDDVAAAILFLTSGDCALTGDEIVVDGGLIALGPRA
jgi:3-oxoacyl-[acyl-carrier protein] reductase